MTDSSRHQALLNEYKGNLYEYLVGVELARGLKLETYFLTNLSSGFRQMLGTQESFIREFYPHLLQDLPALAKILSQGIIKKFNLEQARVLEIQIIGKVALAGHDDRFSEADLLIRTEDNIYPISIKLSKAHAYVNTKSGGVKSFFSKYFLENEVQNTFSRVSDNLIEKLGRDLCSKNDIEYDYAFKNWIDQGLPELPGQLNGDCRVIYKDFLFNLNLEIYKNIKYLKETSDSFSNSLLSLLGFSDSDIIQATTYYKFQDEHYVFTKNIIENSELILKDIKNVKLGELKESAANFDLIFSDRILQLRLKAMNKFTSKSYKINCSVKIN